MLLEIVFIFSQAHATTDFSEMSRKAVQMRMDVETLSRDVEAQSRRQASELDSMLSRKADLEAQVRKEELREAQLNEKILVARKRVAPKRPATKAELGILREWAVDLQKWVAQSLPFRRAERGADLERILQRLEKNESAELVAADLWSFTDKEIKISKDNSVEILTLDLDGAPAKAEVARLGWLQMAYVTSDGRVGYARRTAGNWSFTKASDSGEEASIRRLVSKMKDGKGAGAFEVPLVEGEGI